MFCFAPCSVSLLGGGLIAWVFYQDITGELPAIERLTHYAPPSVTRVYASDRATFLGEFYLEKRYPLPLSKIPLSLQRAFLASEERTSITIPGSTFRRYACVYHQLARGAHGAGGKYDHPTNREVGLLNSGTELSSQNPGNDPRVTLERQLTRSKFELYLNQIYLGSGAYGVEAAAREYFNKSVADLTLPEVAMIAGLAPAPSAYDPFKNLEGAKERQRYVLERMMEERYISYAQAMTAWQEQAVPSQRLRSRIPISLPIMLSRSAK